MRIPISIITALALLGTLIVPASASSPYRAALRLKDRRVVTMQEMLEDLRGAEMVFIGEDHDDVSHHQAQFDIISALHESDAPIAIGLEMFRAESQRQLDLWTARKMDQESFIKIYHANWRLPWSLYRDIFLYAREHVVPLIGLNIPEAISAKISREGFASLTPAERQQLPPGISCSVDPKYMDFIRRAYHAHGRFGEKAFARFCEAQMVWDKAMAFHLIQYKKRHKDQTIVVLTGNGHAWKPGIPEQVRQESKYSFRVVLPSLPQSQVGEGMGFGDADYLLLR